MSSDESDWEDASKHNALLDDICNLDRKSGNTKQAMTKFSKKTSEKVQLSDLLGSIKSTRNIGDLKKKLEGYEEDGQPNVASKKSQRKIGKSRVSRALQENTASKKVLSAPLHRQAMQRIESKAVYYDLKKDLHQWNAIVHRNRVAEQIHFPLNEDPKEFSRRATTAEKASDFQPKTDLERLTAEILGTSKYNITNDNKYCEAEKEVIKSMSVKEARKRCEELQKMRAIMSYKGAKLKHQAKIKSKQYHRIHKREKRRKLIKEIEALLVKDPEAAAERLKDLEKDRTFERATLKHRGLNRWSREMKQFAARNPEARQLLDTHLRLGRELQGHTSLGALDGSDSDVEEKKEKLTIGDIVEKASEQVSKETNNEQVLQIINSENPFLRSALEAIRDERRKLLEEAKTRVTETSNRKNDKSKEKTAPKASENVLVLESKPVPSLPDELMNGLNDYDAEMQENFIAEAYQDDDVLDEFRKEKKRVEEEEQPEAVDLNLNGWGSWTGPGIIDRKRKEFIVQPKKLKRRDAGKDKVIIRETTSQGVADLQPCDVPFPFTSMRDYETYINQPLGRDWSSELSHCTLVQPKIHTSAGRIIRPLEKSEKQRILESDDSD